VDDRPVIALVASAGGFEAVTSVLAQLPAGLQASVIVLIHQQPDRASALAELLANRSQMPVGVAHDGDLLEPGKVLVVPPGSHLLVTRDRAVALIASGAAPPSRPSADLLLATLAMAVGPRATAVVLSGAGHDGATGATAIHKQGGTVLATDEATSKMFSMPHATIERSGVINHVAPLEEIAPLIARLVSES
jgi:two-component system, chemotaxis family, protein-glutamate methylesterase/glutaminase